MMNQAELERAITEFMDSLTTMTLACSDPEGPWAADVYYARDGLNLLFFSSSRSRHSTAFSLAPRAAATIHGQYSGWQQIKGLQMEGYVEPVTSMTASIRALTIYTMRYPFVKEFFGDPVSVSAQLARKMGRVKPYVFRPRTILYVDNAEGFGTRWKLEIIDGRPTGEPVKVKG